jgi:hypothetical protein
MDSVEWTLKYKRGGSQDRKREPYNEVVKVGEGWVDLVNTPLSLQGCQMSKYLTGACTIKLFTAVIYGFS